MKLNLKTLIAGLTIIIATNAVALIGVAYNRSGEPDAKFTTSGIFRTGRYEIFFLNWVQFELISTAVEIRRIHQVPG